MALAHIDAPAGLSADMLLGALLDVGASLEVVEAAVGALGVGHVRITMGRVRRGDATAVSVRVRAPEETPGVDSWSRIEGILRFVALDDAVRDRALATVGRLVAAEATDGHVDVADVALPQAGVLDTLAVVVAVVAALADLEVDDLTVGPIGVGVSSAIVRDLLTGYTLETVTASGPLVTATAAAVIATLARPAAAAPPMTALRIGIGAGGGDATGETALRLHLGQPTTA